MINNTNISVPGGKIKQLASNSYVADGKTHAQGGIKLNKKAEIEDKEVIVQNNDNTTSIFSQNLGYAKIAKILAKQKGELESNVVKQDLKIQKLSTNKSSDPIAQNTIARKIQTSSIGINNNIQNINDIDNKLAQLVQLQEIEKEQKGLVNPNGEHGWGSWLPVLGGAAGFLIGGPMGALIGAGAGSALGGSIDESNAQEQADKQLQANLTLAEQQRKDHLANMAAYKSSTDKIFANYKPIKMQYATYNHLKNGGILPNFISTIPKGKYFIGGQLTRALQDQGYDTSKMTVSNNNVLNTGNIGYNLTSDQINTLNNTNFNELQKSVANTDLEKLQNDIKQGNIKLDNGDTKETNLSQNPLVTAKFYENTYDPSKYSNLSVENITSNKVNDSELYKANGYNVNNINTEKYTGIGYNASLVNDSDLGKAEFQKVNTQNVTLSDKDLATTERATAEQTQAELAKTNLSQVGFNVNSQLAAINANKSATNDLIMSNTSNSATARALAMRNNLNSTLASAQILENKENIEGQQRSQNTDRLNQTEQLNTSIKNQINQFNTANRQQVNLTNAAEANATNKFNANANIQTQQFNVSEQNRGELANAQLYADTSKFNADTQSKKAFTNAELANQASQFSANALNQSNQFNAASTNQTNQFNTSEQNKAALFSADASNQASQYNISSQNQINQFNSSEANKIGMFNAEQKSNVMKYNADLINNIAASNVNAKNQAEQFNVSQTNAFNSNIYNNDVAQNQYITGLQYDRDNTLYNKKYGGKIPTVKFGYGGIIDQYYSNLFGAKNKYYDFMVQKNQASADNANALFMNLISTGASMYMMNKMKPGAGIDNSTKPIESNNPYKSLSQTPYMVNQNNPMMNNINSSNDWTNYFNRFLNKRANYVNK